MSGAENGRDCTIEFDEGVEPSQVPFGKWSDSQKFFIGLDKPFFGSGPGFLNLEYLGLMAGDDEAIMLLMETAERGKTDF